MDEAGAKLRTERESIPEELELLDANFRSKFNGKLAQRKGPSSSGGLGAFKKGLANLKDCSEVF
jgi:hypothetical protein